MFEPESVTDTKMIIIVSSNCEHPLARCVSVKPQDGLSAGVPMGHGPRVGLMGLSEHAAPN